MFLRVRGGGATADNSLAITMHLRSLKRELRSRESTESASHPVVVALDGSYSHLQSIWHEVWNLYDICYSDHSEVGIPLPAYMVTHQLSFSDQAAALTAVGEARMLMKTQWEEPTPLTLVLYKPDSLLSLIWIASYAQLVIHLLLRHTENVQVKIVVGSNSWNAEAELEFACRFVTTIVSSNVSIHTSDPSEECLQAPHTIVVMSDRQRESSLQSQHVLVVPVEALVDMSDGTTQSDKDLAAISRENMIKNFCPCCGPTDRPGCSGHFH